MQDYAPFPQAAPPSRNRGGWVLAWVLSFLLHVLAFVGLRQYAVPVARAAKADTVQIQLVPPNAAANDESKFFSELPPDRADQAPKHADFLSNVTSRARDQVPGGQDALPHMTGDADVPTVHLDQQQTPSTGAQRSIMARPQATSQTIPLDLGDQSIKDPDSGSQTSGASSDQPPGTAGSSGVPQPDMANPSGNAPLGGEVSLNTTAWDYAPWLQEFGRQLMRRWNAPEAYYLGILKDGGWGLFEVEITKDGKMIRLEKLDEQGHPSLIQAAQSALHSMAPIRPLPNDFPEPTLILRIRMIYPKIRPREPAEEPPPHERRRGRH